MLIAGLEVLVCNDDWSGYTLCPSKYLLRFTRPTESCFTKKISLQFWATWARGRYLCPLQGGWSWMILKVPPNPFYGLWKGIWKSQEGNSTKCDLLVYIWFLSPRALLCASWCLLLSFQVLVWIHGGGLVFGAASSYDGSALAAFDNVVVVTIQYRLGIAGYFR